MDISSNGTCLNGIAIGRQNSRAKAASPSQCPSTSSGRAWQLWLARRSQGRDRPTGRPATASGVAASKVADFPAFGHVGGDIMHADGTVLHTVGAGAATARAAEAAPSAPSGSSV